jgi:hypothetical protein
MTEVHIDVTIPHTDVDGGDHWDFGPPTHSDGVVVVGERSLDPNLRAEKELEILLENLNQFRATLNNSIKEKMRKEKNYTRASHK